VAAKAAALADRGLRVLGVARQCTRGTRGPLFSMSRLEFSSAWSAWLIPLRPEVPAAVENVDWARIRVIMITVPFREPRRRIAAARRHRYTRILSGMELQHWTPSTSPSRSEASAYSPRDATAETRHRGWHWKADGEIVAMTGEAVKRCPCAQSAHIGIAMGQARNDVARRPLRWWLPLDRRTFGGHRSRRSVWAGGFSPTCAKRCL